MERGQKAPVFITTLLFTLGNKLFDNNYVEFDFYDGLGSSNFPGFINRNEK